MPVNYTQAEMSLEDTPAAVPDAPETKDHASMLKSAKLLRLYHLHREQVLGCSLGVLSVGMCLFCWYMLTVNKIDFYIRFENVPSPIQVVRSLMKVVTTDAFLGHILASSRRIVLGFLMAAAVAIPIGLLIGRFKLLRAVLSPIIEITRPIPAIAWVPLSIMLWPTSEESILFITFLGSVFPVLLNTISGMEHVDPVLVRAARSLGASEYAVFMEVYLPGAMPQIFTGLAVGMGVAWVSLIAAEMISGQFGIGYFTWQAYSLVDYPDIVLGMITIGLLGLASSWAIRCLGAFLMPWRASR
jgi:NitT/TauT family transport system permease protein